MPNGKGHLDCCYCIHWRNLYKGYESAYQEGFCNFHQDLIPSTLPLWTHRICKDFKPDEYFQIYAERISLEERFSWFGIDLEKGILYGFSHNAPFELEVLKTFKE